MDDDLLPICNDKPIFLNKNESLNEMIQKLKNDGRNYSESMFLRLLQLISRKNIVNITDLFNSSLKSSIHRLTDTLEFIDNENDEIVEKSLRDLIFNALDTFNIATERITEETKKLNNFLIKHSEVMKSEITDFIIQNKGANTKKEEKMIISFINNLSNWNIQVENQDHISNDSLYTITNFYKTMVQDIVSTFPNIILNQVDYSDIQLPSYWGLSQNHSKDIKTSINDCYMCLRNFYNDDSFISLLNTIQKSSKNFIILSNETPAFTSIHYKGKELLPVFDERTSKLLCEYYLLRVFINYIDLSKEESMVQKTKTITMEMDDLFTVEYLNDNERKINSDISQFQEKDLVLVRGDVKQLKQKTAKLLLQAHNYLSTGRKILLIKPSIDNRSNNNMIFSRSITGVKADLIMTPEMNTFDSLNLENINCILVDEAQFLSDINVNALREIANKIPVFCYGLKTDYKTILFSGSKRLLELADIIEEIKTVCVMCSQKSNINAKISKDKVIIRDGSSEPDLGFEDKYQAMCWNCYNQ
jgi:thymidine kinase